MEQLETLGRAAINSAKSVLPIYLAGNPKDNSASEAINAATAYWDNPTTETMNAAADAASKVAGKSINANEASSPAHIAGSSAMNAALAAATAFQNPSYAENAANLAATLAARLTGRQRLSPSEETELVEGFPLQASAR